MRILLSCLMVLGAAGCGGETNGSDDAGLDAGSLADSGGGDDAGSVTDAGPGDDAGPDVDAGDTTDAGAGTCTAAGVECIGFPTTFDQNATSVDNCVGHAHQTDCCGAVRVFGVNHSARVALCPAEDLCSAMYATPACSDDTITTDTGDTTTTLNEVRVRCVPNGGATCVCETFVCTNPSCMANSVEIGSCG